ncbi:hypothetical protein U1Q18_051040 [Sarracenia purpurea var. burkii]
MAGAIGQRDVDRVRREYLTIIRGGWWLQWRYVAIALCLLRHPTDFYRVGSVAKDLLTAQHSLLDACPKSVTLVTVRYTHEVIRLASAVNPCTDLPSSSQLVMYHRAQATLEQPNGSKASI